MYIFIARQHVYVRRARYCYDKSVCLSVCLSVTLRYYIETNTHISPNKDFFYIVLEMGSVTHKLLKWVTLPLMPTKMGSLQRQQNSF